MRNLHLEKQGLRGLAIAESFRQDSKESLLAGVVMRRDLTIDGFVFGKTTLEGNDATESILKMYYKLQRPDISYIMVSGLIISMYNIVNIKKIADQLQIPIIGVTYHKSEGIEDAIKHHFPENYESKISDYKKLGNRQKITLKTSHDVYVRIEGCSIGDVTLLLNDMTLQGSIPEPLRVAQLLANVRLQEK